MSNKKAPQQEKNLYAVLIGINDYSKKDHNCSPLHGCINDVLAISNFFKELCDSQEIKVNWKPMYYLAPHQEEKVLLEAKGLKKGNEESTERKEGFYYHPTKDNIIQAFGHFSKADEKKGDYCLLYYSGHGSYVLSSQVGVFSEFEPSGELQTLICADTPRNELLDKELGYLIAKTLEGKEPVIENNRIKEGVHFLTIMDCCHAGSNTRDEGVTLTSRKGPRSSIVFDHDSGEIYGFTTKGNCFYEPFEAGQKKVKPYVGLKHARYVNLSAARDTESAYELDIDSQNKGKVEHGIFTYNLIRILEKNGVKISYKELMDRVKVEVRNWVENQYPLLGKTHEEDEQLLFLGSDFVNPKREYRVSFRRKPQEEWWINAGSLHGMVPSSGDQRTIVHITDGKQTGKAELTEVRVTESILNGPFLEKLDKEDTGLKATIEEMAFAKITVGFGEKLPVAMRNSVEEAWKEAPILYAVLAKPGEVPMFEINPIKNSNGPDSFILTRAKGDKDTPLFVRHTDPATFLVDVEKIARFHSVIEMENPDPDTQTIDDIQIEIQKLEGVVFNKSNIETIDAKAYETVNLEAGVTLRYKKVGGKYRQPALKVRVSSKSGKEYTVGALYCNHSYKISSKYLPPTQIGIKYQSSVELKFRTGKEEYPAVPLNVPNKLFEVGITEVTDYLLLFIAEASEIDLSQFDQEGVKFDTDRKYRTGEPKSKEGFAEDDEGGEELKKDKWSTKLIPIRVIRPQEERTIVGSSKGSTRDEDQAVGLSGFKLVAPTGFSAGIHPTNLASARRKAEMLERAEESTREILPPPGIWSGLEATETIFSRCLATSPDIHLSILELMDVKGSLSAEQPLTIIPRDSLGQDETILSVAYDRERDLYLPVGYANREGEVVVSHLTNPTFETIGPDGMGSEESAKSVGGSIKLFFKKLIWSKLSGVKDYHTLSLIQPNGKELEKKAKYHGRDQEAAEKESIKDALITGQPALLLLHSITGDTDGMAEAVFNTTALHENYGAVLAFDYENLNTTVHEAAKQLKTMLAACGVQGKQLTIIGHGTGGLVARSLIEKQGAAAWVDRLIQVGTPNGGMKIAAIRKTAVNWLTLGINGFALLQPYLPFLAFAGRLLDTKLFRSLNQLVATDDDIVQDILAGNEAAAGGVPYYLIAGNTENIEASFEKKDPLFRKIKAAIRDRMKYVGADLALFGNEPNDLIVRLESMQALSWAFAAEAEVSCDHMRYFENEEVLEKLEGFLAA